MLHCVSAVALNALHHVLADSCALLKARLGLAVQGVELRRDVRRRVPVARPFEVEALRR